MIVRADGRTSEARFEMDATEGDLLAGAPVVVLVDHGSASVPRSLQVRCAITAVPR
jgi:C-terminal processing protease CtpA/Prc